MTRCAPDTDTIAARATAAGEAAIAIIRLSGPRAISIARRCFRPHNPERDKSYHMTLGLFINPASGDVVDEIFCVHFPSPHSYTGEDCVEIHGHGGPATVGAILDILYREGARPAQPGEFTRRAFLNGRMDLSAAEAVCDLIQARTERAARIALRQVQGGLAQALKSVRDGLLSLSAGIEARLDFPVETSEEKDKGQFLLDELHGIVEIIHELLQQGKRGRLFRRGARVVILGRPNTGKSSLFNGLLRMERAIVTPHPGTTRDTIEGSVDMDGCPVTFVDTAGLRSSPDEVEALGMDRARAEAQKADLLILLLDCSEPLQDEDRDILNHLGPAPCILALNKTDLPEEISEEALLPFRERADMCVMISALTGAGLPEMEGAILALLAKDGAWDEDALVTADRHIALLEETRASLLSAMSGLEQGMYDELVMVDIRRALLGLSRITGEEVSDEILSLIFSRFCIGK
ncbi:MAG TPA: tRNA uridine-5-carboxymethylaminomethyl(34) synthesis GTPase MnmE [Candidatus Sumerlaeota bacterium]|nr:tRNA uridine-5-carboxymethylaminomethyl(34) synthesis GTPase MnmE [Candidatus Sumerlaeota bacterium]